MQISKPQPLRQFVRAGAGAGKTTNLTQEVVEQALSFKSQTGQWPKTVMTTFTRKATQELKERIIKYCLEKKPEALEFVQSSSYLTITTMHGLFDHFLRRHAVVYGFPSQFNIVDTYKGDFWRKQILKDIFSEHSPFENLLSLMSVTELMRFLKSYESLYWYNEYRIASLEDFKEFAIKLAKSKGEEIKRLTLEAQNLVDGEKWQDYFSNLDNFLSQLLAATSWESILTLIEKHQENFSIPRASKTNPALIDDVRKPLKTNLDSLKSLQTEPEYSLDIWQESIPLLNQFSKLADVYMDKLFKKKAEEACLEADDLENFTLRLVNEKPQQAEKYREAWDLWFIDEFQDTSPKQLKILSVFLRDKSCYIVGDPQQSIYLFRGSRSEVFLDTQKDMEASGAQIKHLQDNYRSQENLLRFFNKFFAFAGEQFNEMNPKVEGVSSKAVIISKINSEDEDCEINHITQQVKSLLEQGVSPKDICILGRRRQDIEKVERALMLSGFPVISHSSANYFLRREIMDAQSLLTLLLNPWDDKNLILWMRSPWMGLEDQSIVNIIGESKNTFWPNFKQYFLSNPQYAAGTKILTAMEAKREWGIGWVFRKLLISLGFMDYSSHIDSTGRREANLWKYINNVEKISREPGQSIFQFLQEGQTAIDLDDIGDSSDASSPVEPDKINLMTVHKSKGLQFKYIFIPFMQKSPNKTHYVDLAVDEVEKVFSIRLPLSEDQKRMASPIEKVVVKNLSQREDEEFLRVLYVAMTRAKSQLYLSWSGKPEKTSWALQVEKFLSQQSDDEFLKVDEVSEAVKATYKQSKEMSGVPKPYINDKERFYLKPLKEVLQKSNYQEQDLLSGQKKRWQGVILHKLFESLKHHDVLKVKELAQKWLQEDHQEAWKALDFVSTQTKVPLISIVQNGFVEWGYQTKKEGKVIERRVDLWGVFENTLWIVDYKTGSVRYKDQAFEQLKEYGEALKEYLSWSGSIRYCVVYPFDEAIEVMNG